MELIPFAVRPDNEIPSTFCGKPITTIPLLPRSPTLEQYAAPLCHSGDARRWCHMLHCYPLLEEDLEVVRDVNLTDDGRHPWDGYVDAWGRRGEAQVDVDDGFSLARRWTYNDDPHNAASPQIDDLVRSLAHRCDAGEVETVFFGEARRFEAWPDHALERIAAALPGVKHIMSGFASYMDAMYSERHSVSLTTMLYLYPELEVFAAGGFREEVEAFQHNGLRHLLLQLPRFHAGIAASLHQLSLPRLESLELWMSNEQQIGPPDDFMAPILSGKLYPQLRSLGLCNIDQGDWTLGRVLGSPLMDRLDRLVMTHTTLGDEVVPDLVRYASRLKQLDVRGCYFSPRGVEQLTSCFGDRVLAGHSRMQGDHWLVGRRYCAVVE